MRSDDAVFSLEKRIIPLDRLSRNNIKTSSINLPTIQSICQILLNNKLTTAVVDKDNSILLPLFARTITSPGWAISSALWNRRLSPAGAFTVNAVPRSLAFGFSGKILESTAAIFPQLSSIFATGIPRKASTNSFYGLSKFRLILHPNAIWKPLFFWFSFLIVFIISYKLTIE